MFIIKGILFPFGLEQYTDVHKYVAVLDCF